MPFQLLPFLSAQGEHGLLCLRRVLPFAYLRCTRYVLGLLDQMHIFCLGCVPLYERPDSRLYPEVKKHKESEQ